MSERALGQVNDEWRTAWHRLNAEVDRLRADLADAQRALQDIETLCDEALMEQAGLGGEVVYVGDIKPILTRLSAGGGGPAEGACCHLHNRNCEPPSELCCENCTEWDHPGHASGGTCIAPDLSAVASPGRAADTERRQG